MNTSTIEISAEQEKYRKAFTQELADVIGCEPEKLPATTSKEVACKFLDLSNHKTLDVWRCQGRHGIVMLKVGKYSRPATDWMINLKLSSLSIAGVAN